MNGKRIQIFLGMAVLLLIESGAAAAEVPRAGEDSPPALARYDTIAVMPFQNATNDQSLDWLSMGIPETITVDLGAIVGIVLIERIQLWRIMEEQALQLAGAISDASAMEIGQLVGANLLVVGAFQKQGSTMRLTARFVEAETGSVVHSAKVTGGLNDIFDLQDDLVGELVKSRNLSAAGTKAVGPAPQITKSVEAFRHYGQATLHQARGEYQGAVEEYRKALDLDPGFSMARDRFSEAFFALGADSRWEYERVESGAEKAEPGAVIQHRAGGLSNLKGKSCYTYVNKAAGAVQAGDSIGLVTEYYERGADGVYLAGELTDPDLGSETLRIFSPSVLMFPYEMEAGMKWSSEHRVKERRPAGSGSVLHQQATVLRKENLEIPRIGTLECYVIRYDQRVTGDGSPATIWFAPGVGIVKLAWQEAGDKSSGPAGIVEIVLKGFSLTG